MGRFIFASCYIYRKDTFDWGHIPVVPASQTLWNGGQIELVFLLEKGPARIPCPNVKKGSIRFP